MELTIAQYFLLFMIYSVAGWILEVTCKLIEYKRFINRGFLIGPYCPIYGWGAIFITILLHRYTDDWIALFFMSVITCGILEYLTSYVMEKLFHARWWDYSRRKYNINGRVCLETLIPFGILGLAVMYVTNPLILAGFGLKDSITDIVHNQFERVNTYDISVTVNTDENEEMLLEKLKKDDRITESVEVNMQTGKLSSNNIKRDVKINERTRFSC